MLVTRPMSPVRTRATTPASIAIPIESAQMNTTRPSTSARSGGTRDSVSAGPSDGATGSPSVVWPLASSLGTAHCLLEEHRRRLAGDAELARQLLQSSCERDPPGWREALDRFDQALLGERGGSARRLLAPLRQAELDPAAIARGTGPPHQPALDQAAHHGRDGALVRQRAPRQLRGRERGAGRPQLLQHEQLGGGEARAHLG